MKDFYSVHVMIVTAKHLCSETDLVRRKIGEKIFKELIETCTVVTRLNFDI